MAVLIRKSIRHLALLLASLTLHSPLSAHELEIHGSNTVGATLAPCW